jgi:hypothetical protein
MQSKHALLETSRYQRILDCPDRWNDPIMPTSITGPSSCTTAAGSLCRQQCLSDGSFGRISLGCHAFAQHDKERKCPDKAQRRRRSQLHQV